MYVLLCAKKFKATSQARYEAEIWYVNSNHKCKISQGVLVGLPTFLTQSPSNYNLFYHTRIWLSKILTGQKFDSQISLNIVKEVIEGEELDKGNISAASGK